MKTHEIREPAVLMTAAERMQIDAKTSENMQQ